jgi:ribosomal protein S18 acetylase RimI-like enzyme
MSVRRATTGDLPRLEGLWRASVEETPPPSHIELDHDHEIGEVREIVDSGLAFVAEREGAIVGFALARREAGTLGRLTDLYVVPSARRSGVAAALVAEVAVVLDELGVEHLDLEVTGANSGARAVYQRWGFVEHTLVLSTPVHLLRERLVPGQHAVSFASIHVQTDELGDVERAAAAFAPRIGSRAWRVEGPRNGWTAVYDEVIDQDPTALVRFARELSSRLGAIVIALSLEVDQVVRLVALERGGIVDEYLSVPEFYGSLPPGDVIGLAANPTVLHRLTGADPEAVRAVARTAPAPAGLPPARELLAGLAAALGLEGSEHGYASPSGAPEPR